jgi:AcrR family transcriptional regulator
MRRLGRDLGVEAMAIYHHVANKSEVMAGVMDLVAAEIPEPPPDLTWKAELRHRAIATHAALMRHPWSAMAWVSGATAGPARLAQADAGLAALRRAGFPPMLLELAFHTVQNHVTGHAVQAVDLGRQRAQAGGEAALARFLERPDLARFPDLVAHVRWHMTRPPAENAFVFSLDLLLDGLEQALAGWTEPTREEPRG